MSIILSGCGGGCDLFGAIPYFYKLKNSIPKNIILVNLSFTDELNLRLLSKKNKVKCLSKTLYKVDARHIENNKEKNNPNISLCEPLKKTKNNGDKKIIGSPVKIQWLIHFVITIVEKGILFILY